MVLSERLRVMELSDCIAIDSLIFGRRLKGLVIWLPSFLSASLVACSASVELLLLGQDAAEDLIEGNPASQTSARFLSSEIH